MDTERKKGEAKYRKLQEDYQALQKCICYRMSELGDLTEYMAQAGKMLSPHAERVRVLVELIQTEIDTNNSKVQRKQNAICKKQQRLPCPDDLVVKW